MLKGALGIPHRHFWNCVRQWGVCGGWREQGWCLKFRTFFSVLPRWLSGKESACQTQDAGLIHGSGRSPGGEMATHSSILAWKIQWTEVPGRLQSTGLQRVGHNWECMHYTLPSFHLFYLSHWILLFSYAGILERIHLENWFCWLTKFENHKTKRFVKVLPALLYSSIPNLS